jgi:hypothetical protein
MDGGPVQVNGDVRITSVGVDAALGKTLARLVHAVEAASLAWERAVGLLERSQGTVNFFLAAAGGSLLMFTVSRLASTIYNIRNDKKP